MRAGTINWKKTHDQTVDLLKDEMLPWHYKQLYHKAVSWGARGCYSPKTDPMEKFRQYYAEHDHPPVAFIPNVGGYLALHRWFPQREQLNLWPPQPIEIQGDCIISYEAGFEQGKREDYMKDWFDDADTTNRHERRRRGALVENHVKAFFRENYPKYFRPASNEGEYSKPASDDFQLEMARYRILVDVKSKSYNKRGQKYSPVRHPKDDVIYLFAEWKDDHTTSLFGISSGRRIKKISSDLGDLMHVAYNRILPVDCFLVFLNMERARLSYSEFYKNLATNK